MKSLAPLPLLVSSVLTLSAMIDPPSTLSETSKSLAEPSEGDLESSEDRQQVEVAFILDTTGSMSGLIEGAKQKIWSIAQEIVSAEDQPHVKFALIGYRDRGDDYITKTYDLTSDLDLIYAHLMEFTADGGGDLAHRKALFRVSCYRFFPGRISRSSWDRPLIRRQG
ncbi:MAG: VWA domain-containing protein [Verrucomicrobiota bacterium]